MRRAVMIAVLAAAISGTHVQAADRPNVILILSDDHRWDGIGAAGNPNVVTPNLDRLARTGVYFPQAVAHVPQCSPNRATLLTGLSPHQTGWFSNQSQRKEIVAPDGLGKYPLLPKLLQDAGYDTAFVGKWHLAQEPWLSGFSDVRTWLPSGSGPYRSLPVAHGRSRVLAPANGFTQEVFADDAIEYVNGAARRQRPFFLWLALTAPHGPFQPNPERIQKLYAGRSTESLLPPGFDRSARMDNWTNYRVGTVDIVGTRQFMRGRPDIGRRRDHPGPELALHAQVPLVDRRQLEISLPDIPVQIGRHLCLASQQTGIEPEAELSRRARGRRRERHVAVDRPVVAQPRRQTQAAAGRAVKHAGRAAQGP